MAECRHASPRMWKAALRSSQHCWPERHTWPRTPAIVTCRARNRLRRLWPTGLRTRCLKQRRRTTAARHAKAAAACAPNRANSIVMPIRALATKMRRQAAFTLSWTNMKTGKRSAAVCVNQYPMSPMDSMSSLMSWPGGWLHRYACRSAICCAASRPRARPLAKRCTCCCCSSVVHSQSSVSLLQSTTDTLLLLVTDDPILLQFGK